MAGLPPLAPFPETSWQHRLRAKDWEAAIEAWTTLISAYMRLSDERLQKLITRDDSALTFLKTYVTAAPSAASTSSTLRKSVFQLSSRLLSLQQPNSLFDVQFLSDLAKTFSADFTRPLFSSLFASKADSLELPLSRFKKALIPQLGADIKGDLRDVEAKLSRIVPLLHASPHVGVFFLAGSDFLDGLIACFKVMNPPLRHTILVSMYLSLVALIKVNPPKWTMLSDQLFVLKEAAEAHKLGPLNVKDSLVANLVTATPLLKTLLHSAERSKDATELTRKRIPALEPFKSGVIARPRKRVNTRADKGKGKATHEDVRREMHMHLLSRITQVQDLFPDLGAGFVAKCLDEYGDDVEQVVANLLNQTLPPHLAAADKREPLSDFQTIVSPGSVAPQTGSARPLQQEGRPGLDLAPRSTQLDEPAQMPIRRNVFDDNEFDRLTADVSSISFSKKPVQDADAMLQDRSKAPAKAAILSALAAFDSDDDERNDTYDAVDVGGTVDSANQEADNVDNATEEILYRAYKMDGKLFGRDASTRRGAARAKLREQTAMTDEAIEGWALMLGRNGQQRKRLEAKYAFSGQQAELERTSWRASPAASGAEESEPDARAARGQRAGHRGRVTRSAQGRGRGQTADAPTPAQTEAARRNKEAHKGSRANHNRRDARAKKTARGGFTG